MSTLVEIAVQIKVVFGVPISNADPLVMHTLGDYRVYLKRDAEQEIADPLRAAASWWDRESLSQPGSFAIRMSRLAVLGAGFWTVEVINDSVPPITGWMCTCWRGLLAFRRHRPS